MNIQVYRGRVKEASMWFRVYGFKLAVFVPCGG